MNTLKIVSHCYVSGNLLVEQYRELGIQYPKFFKMDNLSKLGYLTASKLCLQNNIQQGGNHFALMLACRASSLDIDTDFQKTISDIDNYFPSPSLFVYTLPNIVLGEIAIAYKIKGETTMIVAENLQQANLQTQIELLFEQTDAKQLIGGWIDYSAEHKEAFMFLLESDTEGIDFTNNNLNKLYENGREDFKTERGN